MTDQIAPKVLGMEMFFVDQELLVIVLRGGEAFGWEPTKPNLLSDV